MQGNYPWLFPHWNLEFLNLEFPNSGCKSKAVRYKEKTASKIECGF